MIEKILMSLKGSCVYIIVGEYAYYDYLFLLTAGWTVYNTTFKPEEVEKIIVKQDDNVTIVLK